MLRAGDGDPLGDRELEEDFGDHLVKIGCSEDLAKEQVLRLRRVRDFVAKSRENRRKRWKRSRRREVSGEEESLEVGG